MAVPLNSLVIYKKTAALVRTLGEKIEIELEFGEIKKVREKDFILINNGPIKSFSDIDKVILDNPSIEEAHELLLENSVSFFELTELICGDTKPGSSLAVWKLFSEGHFFKGTIECVEARTNAEISSINEKIEIKNRAVNERSDFIKRLKSFSILESDKRHLIEIEKFALKQSEESKLMAEADFEQSFENAHRILLKLGYWNNFFNPYPQRFNIPLCNLDTGTLAFPDEDRIDLTHLKCFAIDDEGCNDPDDAISFEKGFLWVHIADPSALIDFKSELDDFASLRGSNLYLPEKIIPMLPDRITELAALGLESVSNAFSFKISFDDDFTPKLEEMVLSKISVTRYTYEKVESMLEKEELSDVFAITKKYRERRFKNGAVKIELPEAKITVSNENVKILSLPHLKSREMVEDAMLIAGEAVGRFAIENNFPLPFSTQNISDNLILPEEPTLSDFFNARFKMKPSELSVNHSKHAGLGLDIYVKLTSPLRRYMDLLVHEQLRRFILQKPLISQGDIEQRITKTSYPNKDIKIVERLSNRHWTLVYMDSMKWKGKGILVDLLGGIGTFIIPELGFEVKTPAIPGLELDKEVNLNLTEVDLPSLKPFMSVTNLI